MELTIGQRIRKRREELNMTQDELAQKLGYASRSSVNKIELSREVPMKMINKYATALDTTVAALMGWQSDIYAMAEIDAKLSEMPTNLKEYALKLAELPKEAQEIVMSMIDMMYKK